jgi:hypothetical protein
MARFHESLARRAAEDRHFHFHYVTAREMYNLARAAGAGWDGSVDEARDFELTSQHGTDMKIAPPPRAGAGRKRLAPPGPAPHLLRASGKNEDHVSTTNLRQMRSQAN